MTHTPLVALSTAVAPARDRHRDLLSAAARWQEGRPPAVDPDLFALICDAAQECLGDVVSPTRWTRTGLAHLLSCDLPNWCSQRRCLVPDGEIGALWRWIDFLHGTGRLHPDSDPVAELRKPLCCAGWLDQDGAPLPDDAARQVECECFLPYRAGARLLGELAQAAAERGEDVLDPLRRALGRPRRWADEPWTEEPWTEEPWEPFIDGGPGWSGSGP